MGSGKGNPEYWVAVVKPGRVLFEVAGVTRAQAKEALRRAAMKMPMDCQFIERQHIGLASTSEDAESDVAGEVVA
jgi:large subunit ribosomal protein L16